MLSGYEETEREILATLKIDSNLYNSNNQKYINYSNDSKLALQNRNSSNKTTSFYSNRFMLHKAKSRFRTGVICIIAISRIK
jgi:hypothetical protein